MRVRIRNEVRCHFGLKLVNFQDFIHGTKIRSIQNLRSSLPFKMIGP